MNHKYLLEGALFCDRFPFLGNACRVVLVNFVIPFYFLLLKVRFNVKFRVVLRHSVKKNNFNPFLSDIDYNLVLEDDSQSYRSLIRHISHPDTKFKILDVPQVYFESEYRHLPDVDSDEYLGFFWFFRKYEWIKLRNNYSDYEYFKKNKAFQKIFEKNLRNTEDGYTINNLKLPGIPVSDDIEVCIYNHYLELTSPKRVLECSLKQFHYITSLLPGEDDFFGLKQIDLEIKKNLWIHEYLLSKSDLRVKQILGNDVEAPLNYILFLERKYEEIIGEKLPNITRYTLIP